MPIAFIGESKSKPESAEALRELLLTVVAPALQAAEGCHSYQVFQSQDDPTKFIGVEIWDSVEHHRASVKEITPEEIAKYRSLVEGGQGGYYNIV
jgi:quinol monooxygenase YgiN